MSYRGRGERGGRGGGFENGGGRGGSGSYGGGGGRGRGGGGYEGRGGGSYEGRGGGRGGGSYEGRGGGGRGGGFESRGGSGSFRGGGRGMGAAPIADRLGPIEMVTNHYKLTVDDNAKPLHHHLVEISSQQDSAVRMVFETRREILSKFLEAMDVPLLNVAYDGDRILVSPERINKTMTIQRGQAAFTVVVSPQGSPFKLKELLESTEPLNQARAQTLEVIMKVAAREHCEQGNLQSFYHDGSNWMKDLGDYARCSQGDALRPKQLWMGHYQTVAFSDVNRYSGNTTRQASLLVNAAGTVAYESQPLIDFITARTKKRLDQVRHLDSGTAREFDMQVRGLKFELTHFANPRTCKLLGLVPDTAMTKTFDCEGEQMTVAQYFKRKYDLTLKYPNAPLVQKAPKRAEVFLPLEVVRVKKQKLTGTVTEFLKSIVGDIMTMEPGKRLEYIKQSTQFSFGSNDVLKMFGIHLSPDAMRIRGTVLEPPSLAYAQAGSTRPASIRVAQGKWNLMNAAFTSTAKLASWGVLNCANVHEGDLRQCVGDMITQANQKLNMQINPSPMFAFSIRDEMELTRQANSIRQKAQEGKRLDLLFVIIRDRNTIWYKQIKSLFDELVTTQVLTAQKTPILNGKDRGKEGHFANILMKINQKIGGTNQIINHTQTALPALRHLIPADGQAVVIGADLTVPSAAACPQGARRAQLPSLSALVCSVDMECTKYIHSWRGQIGQPDNMLGFADMLVACLERRAKLLDLPKWPSRVIYLRDGISDGGIEEFIKNEVRVIGDLYQSHQQPIPKILAIAVRKRHQTRFFPTDAADPRTNMPPGTLVFDNLTLPVAYPNFYLLSHAGIKGTSHPARYIVCHDDFKIHSPVLKTKTPQELLEFYAHFCYQLCHIYGRCTRSVSIPAPVYYAGLVAERARIHVNDIARQVYGVGVLSDATSNSSGHSHDVFSPLDEATLQKFTDTMNKKLKEVELATRPMFFC